MADNYLERKMEEHRSGRSSSSTYHPTTTPRGTRPGEWVVRFTPCQVLIEDIERDTMLQLARELIAIGFKVCFRHPDIHRGQKLASTIGARLLPPGMEADPDCITITTDAKGEMTTISRTGQSLDVPHTLPGSHVNAIIFSTITFASQQ